MIIIENIKLRKKWLNILILTIDLIILLNNIMTLIIRKILIIFDLVLII